MKKMLLSAAILAAVSTSAVAQIVPGNQNVDNLSSPVPAGQSWGTVPGEDTGGGSATINSGVVTDADGSLNITGDRSRVQTGVQYGGAPGYPTNTGVSANSIVDLTGDYVINSLGTNSAATPAFRVLIQDGSARSELIWEGAYNDPATNEGLGAGSADAGDLFWQYVAGCGATLVGGGCTNTGTYVLHTLADWGDLYSADAFVSALSIGVGSGAGSGFDANVDNVAFTTDAGTTRYNFTTQTAAVPEPATWAMMLFGFAGIGVQMRRKRQQSLPQIA
jgi:hypothetical protein